MYGNFSYRSVKLIRRLKVPTWVATFYQFANCSCHTADDDILALLQQSGDLDDNDVQITVL